ncbi:MAG: ABC transporter ATP-binding protein [Candidatus Micrarchaeota archaeon]
MAKLVLELQNVSKVYHLDLVEVTAVRNIDLKIYDGEFVAIMGASGSGKSTMLNLIGALDSPTGGKVLIDGTDITSLSENQVARIRGKKIGFVFQNFNLYPTLNVSENIALPMKIHEFNPAEITKKVNELVRLVGLENRKNHLPGQLSGGERQRIAVARALSTTPSLMLADEPTGNLDTKTSVEIMSLFENLNKKESKTIVLVTHENDIAAVADRIVTMRDGKIVSDVKNKKKEKRK